MSKDPNSRTITIFRTNSFLDDAQKKDALEFVSMSKKSLGSYWESNQSRVSGSGLTAAEQKILMPIVLNMELSDREFRAKCAEYFAEIKTTVPYAKGIELEIGLEDNNEPLGTKLEDGSTNLPLKIYDYIRYRHALAHPEVATSAILARGNQLKQFYIFDPQAEIETNKAEADKKDEALEFYLKIKGEDKKIDMLLTLLKVDPRQFSGANAATLKLEALKAKAEKVPAEFVSIYKDKFFEDMYVIESLVNTNVLNRVGQTLIDPDLGITVGHNMSEAIAWMKDKNNSEKVVILKAKMQEGLARPITARKTRPK